MTTKIKCILLDDELPGLSYLKMLCEQIDELEIIKVYDNPNRFLNEWFNLDFDLLISDIEMPGVNGLNIARQLTDKFIIFTTAYKNFAVDAFDINAVDYVVKPIKKERLQQAIHKVAEKILQNTPKNISITLNTDRGKAILNIEDMLCIITSDIDSRDKVIILTDNTKVTAKNMSFSKLISILPENNFSRINKQVILSLWQVKYYSHDEITTSILNSDGKLYSFALSETYRNSFMKKVKH